MPSHFCVDDAVTVCTTPLTAMGIDASVGIPATIGDLQKVLISNGTCLWPLQGLLPRNTTIGVTRMAGPCWCNIDSCTGQTKVHHPFIFGATVAYNPATQIYTFVASTPLDMVVSLDPLLPNWAVKVGECTAVSGQGLYIERVHPASASIIQSPKLGTCACVRTAKNLYLNQINWKKFT